MFKFKKNYTGYFSIGKFQILLKEGKYSTNNEDIIKLLKADKEFTEEKAKTKTVKADKD